MHMLAGWLAGSITETDQYIVSLVKKIKRDKNINREILRAKWQNRILTVRVGQYGFHCCTLLNAFMLCDKRNFLMNVIALGHLVFQLRYCDV